MADRRFVSGWRHQPGSNHPERRAAFERSLLNSQTSARNPIMKVVPILTAIACCLSFVQTAISAEPTALAGYFNNTGRKEVRGVMGFWWTSTPSAEEGKAWGWNFSYGGPGEKPLKTKAFRFDSSVSHAKSARCVRD